MPPDPNARLVKAVEDLTRAVSDNAKASRELTKELKSRLPKTITYVNHPYLKPPEGVEPDAAEPGGDNSGR